MKKIILISILISALSFKSYSQGGYYSDEYKYWGLKVGLTHSISPMAQDTFNYLFVDHLLGGMKLVPVKNYVGYVPGFAIDMRFNNDFRNNPSRGVVIGLELENYGISNKYESQFSPDENPPWVEQTYRVSQAGLFAAFKFFADYEKQRYFTIGIKADYNIMVTNTEKTSWTGSEYTMVVLDKNEIRAFDYAPLLGFNWGFLSLEANYHIGGFLSKGSEVLLYNKSVTVKPYEYFPAGDIVIKTSLMVPLNSWTARRVFEIGQFLRKLFS